jgi:hypothetical protein
MVKKRQPDEVERDRELIAKLYIQGKKQSAIAEIISAQYKFSVTQQQISLDLGVIRKRWLESSVRDFDAAKSEQLAKIDHMESEAWDAWEKSKGKHRQVTTKKGINGKGEIDETTVKVEDLIGNPAYMNIIDRCIERRCRLLGLDAELRYTDVNLAIAAVIRAGFVVQNPTVDVTAIEVKDNGEGTIVGADEDG